MKRKRDHEGRGRRSDPLVPALPSPPTLPAAPLLSVARESAHSGFPHIESWSRLPGFKGFTIRPGVERAFTWTWKAQLPDGRHVYLHGFVSTIYEALNACDYALQREDWRIDKYAK